MYTLQVIRDAAAAAKRETSKNNSEKKQLRIRRMHSAQRRAAWDEIWEAESEHCDVKVRMHCFTCARM